MNQSFDAVVIGAGQAGPSLAGRLTAVGIEVALIERKLIGGTCVNTGCMPTKTLVASAYAAYLARRSADYGIAIEGPIGIDMKRVKARADTVSTNARTNVEKWLRGMTGLTVIEGHACFEPGSLFRPWGSPAAGCEVFAARMGAADGTVGRFFADFDIEILRSVHRGVAPHHRSPASAIKPAGQDLWARLVPGIGDSTAPTAVECHSFLDNLIAEFGRT